MSINGADSPLARGLPARPRAWVTRLLVFTRPEPRPQRERCELCQAEMGSRHPHLVEPATRRIVCVCEGCARLKSQDHDIRFRLIPERARTLPEVSITDAQWEALQIPVGLGFFFYSTPEQRVIASYPSPAGPTESLLALDAWSQIAASNPVLAELEPDVEALLVNRMDGARDHYAVPIDQCYALIGLIRRNWRGLSGGAEVSEAISAFLAGLREGASGGAVHG